MNGKIYSVSKIDAAVDQIDWSIRLFLDQKAYLPAITLAHAAEVSIGESIFQSGGTSALFQIAECVSGITEVAPDKVRQFMNHPATWMKHWKDRTDAEKLDMELDTLAIQYITRAALNLHQHDQTITSEMPRFWAWIRENRPDIDPTREENDSEIR